MSGLPVIQELDSDTNPSKLNFDQQSFFSGVSRSRAILTDIQ